MGPNKREAINNRIWIKDALLYVIQLATSCYERSTPDSIVSELRMLDAILVVVLSCEES